MEETSTVFSAKRLQQARAVLRHSVELAQSVPSGGTKFEAALKQMEDRQKGGRGKRSQISESLGGNRASAQKRLSQARAVLRS